MENASNHVRNDFDRNRLKPMVKNLIEMHGSDFCEDIERDLHDLMFFIPQSIEGDMFGDRIKSHLFVLNEIYYLFKNKEFKETLQNA